MAPEDGARVDRLALELPELPACDRCLDRVRGVIAGIGGVAAVTPDQSGRSLEVRYDPSAVSLGELSSRARDAASGIARRYAHETMPISGLDCADCAAKLEKAVARLPGVVEARVDFALAGLKVEYDLERTGHAQIEERVRALGYRVGAADDTVTATFRLSGLDCADCALTVERNLAALPGVESARVDFGSARLTVTHRASVDRGAIVGAVEGSGYGAYPVANGAGADGGASFWVRNRRAVFALASGVSLALGFLVGLIAAVQPLAQPLFLLAAGLGAFHAARAGWNALRLSRSLDMNILMVVAVFGAIAIGELAEGATVAFLFALGNTLEGYTMDRARGAIRALMELAPNQARVKRPGGEETLLVQEVAVGERVLVRPGEKVPLDGRVVGGCSTVNQAPITGESIPVGKELGDEVFAGSINERGFLEIEVTKPYAENTIARIIRLVEEAQTRRAPSQRFIDKFASRYTPAVIAIAAAIAVVPSLFFGQPLDVWLYRALVLLVIACPCALVISTPVSIVSGIARAAARGVLIKGGAFLEQAGGLRVVAFDKTGTLTTGRPVVTDVIGLNGLSEDEVLRLAAAVEARSEHPLASAVMRRAGLAERNGGHRHSHEEELSAVADFEAVTGRGVRARLDGAVYHVGSPRLFTELGFDLAGVEHHLHALRREGKTVLLVGDDARLIGLVAVADRPRPGAREAVAALRQAGVERVVLLTGDHEETARAIAAEVGADEYRAELLPENKVEAVRQLRERYGEVAMVGDGVNDAPALASATVGIAMGVAGTDAALETADIALMSDDLGRVSFAMALSRRALRTIQQNIAFSLVVKATFLTLALAGLATLWLAILADMGASMLVTLNGMRLLRFDSAPAGCAGGHCAGHR